MLLWMATPPDARKAWEGHSASCADTNCTFHVDLDYEQVRIHTKQLNQHQLPPTLLPLNCTEFSDQVN
jgi:hypothetical protein